MNPVRNAVGGSLPERRLPGPVGARPRDATPEFVSRAKNGEGVFSDGLHARDFPRPDFSRLGSRLDFTA